MSQMYRMDDLDGRELWIVEGETFPPPDTVRWPNPWLYYDYSHDSPDGGYKMWISPEQYMGPGMQGENYSKFGMREMTPDDVASANKCTC